MQQNGYQGDPITGVVRYDGRVEISDGHHRREAAIKAKLFNVPVDIFNPFERKKR